MSVNATACAPKVIEGPEREASGWSVPLGSSTRAPSADERVPAEPSPRWRANVRRGAAGPPALGERVVAITTLDRALTLLEWETGETIWRRNLSAPGSGAPLILGDRVYAATTGRQGRVHAFALRGRRLWEARVGSVVPPIAVTPGTVFVGVEAGLVSAFDADRGQERWSRRLPGVLRLGPVDVGGALFVATDDSLYLLNPADGAITTRARAPVTVVAPPAWRNDTLIIASPDGVIAGVSRTDLAVRWTVRTDADDPVFGGPALARDTVFAVTLGGCLWQIPLAAPDQASQVSLGVTVRAPPAPTADGVLIATTAGEVLLVRAGGAERRARVDGPVEQPPIVRNGVLLVIDGKGRVLTWQ